MREGQRGAGAQLSRGEEGGYLEIGRPGEQKQGETAEKRGGGKVPFRGGGRGSAGVSGTEPAFFF